MIQRTRISQKLRMHELFASVDPAVLESAMDGEYKTGVFLRGDVIADGNTLSQSVVFILSGNAIRQKPGNDLCFKRLPAGSLAGLSTIFHEDSIVPDRITATRETQVLFMSKAVIFKLLQADPDIALTIIRILAGWVDVLERRVTIYTGGSAKSRLARYLADAFGEQKSFVQDRSMQQLATMLDISRPSLYRAFSDLQSIGAIHRDGRLIRLLSRELLMQFVTSE